MILKYFTRSIHSVQAKLIIISLITWICIVLVAGSLFVVHRLTSVTPFHTNAIQYFTYVINDLGSPPDIERARTIFGQTGLKIAFQGDTGSWSLIEALPENNKIRYRLFSNSKTIYFGRYHGRHFLKSTHEKGTFVFEFSGYDKNKTHYLWLLLILLISLSLVLGGAYFAVKKVLAPINWLHEGVKEVGRGNLLHIVPENRKDEFGKLAAAFNAMTRRLHQMLEFKHQLLRDVSHELRSPLTRVKVALEFPSDDQMKKSISGDILEMETMVTAILENARLHHDQANLEKQSSDLAAVVKDIAVSFESRTPGVVFFEHGPVICEFDRARIKTVVVNILENAIKYSTRDSDPVTICLDRHPPWITVKITDTGIGMDKTKLHRVLEPFYRLDKSRSKQTGGYGLGLSLCKTIMDAHNGKIQIDSAPGKGTVVSLFLPLP
ncbi:MAG: HAMP domain-containing histidine kinase [Proteobacteria bacterium]|nr:HAMP domain-containing histidine kinase [Desulfobacula sp.]MBU3952946.1 HAMP domain-containing histidine kinase [Pseudomonadota bacterium]MBU4133412.1 HAMP domain-containing histidine kinase [Pseudomonadota bacterium]